MILENTDEIRQEIQKYRNLSPFELKNELINMAKKTEKKRCI